MLVCSVLNCMNFIVIHRRVWRGHMLVSFVIFQRNHFKRLHQWIWIWFIVGFWTKIRFAKVKDGLRYVWTIGHILLTDALTNDRIRRMSLAIICDLRLQALSWSGIWCNRTTEGCNRTVWHYNGRIFYQYPGPSHQTHCCCCCIKHTFITTWSPGTSPGIIEYDLLSKQLH